MENKELYSALIKFQAEMPSVSKNSNNPFFKSKYADLADIVSEAKPYLAKNGLGIIQEINTNENDGSDYLITTLVHLSGQNKTSSIKIKPKDNTIQQFGAAVTYLRRYAYSSLLGIVADEDDDGNSASVNTPKKAVEFISVDQEEELQIELKGDIETAKKILKSYNIDELSQLPRSAYRSTIDRVRAIKREKQQ